MEIQNSSMIEAILTFDMRDNQNELEGIECLDISVAPESSKVEGLLIPIPETPSNNVPQKVEEKEKEREINDDEDKESEKSEEINVEGDEI